MKSPELQQLTASEPLTLEQEYDMQRSWREDNDSKVLFLLILYNSIIFVPQSFSVIAKYVLSIHRPSSMFP